MHEKLSYNHIALDGKENPEFLAWTLANPILWRLRLHAPDLFLASIPGKRLSRRVVVEDAQEWLIPPPAHIFLSSQPAIPD